MSDRRNQRAAGSPAPGTDAASHPGASPGAQPAHVHLPPATRLEFFSDAVFAFSATLLVVALEVPHTYPELERTLWGFLGFGMSFLALALIWSTHHAYFRRYQLADRATIALNSTLLFVVLFYVYPLKFMTTSLVDVVFGLHPERQGEMFRNQDDVGRMFVVYGLGFLAVFAVFSLLYQHAARSAGEARADAVAAARSADAAAPLPDDGRRRRAVGRAGGFRRRSLLRRAGLRLHAHRPARLVARRLERPARTGGERLSRARI